MLTLCHILHSVSHWPVLEYFIKHGDAAQLQHPHSVVAPNQPSHHHPPHARVPSVLLSAPANQRAAYGDGGWEAPVLLAGVSARAREACWFQLGTHKGAAVRSAAFGYVG
jgi:hypothetical protein